MAGDPAPKSQPSIYFLRAFMAPTIKVCVPWEADSETKIGKQDASRYALGIKTCGKEGKKKISQKKKPIWDTASMETKLIL